jgi:hypothetical protein
MIKHTLTSLALTAALAGAFGPATAAADIVVAPLPNDTYVLHMTALGDTVVWVDGDRRLMRRRTGGTPARVPGAPLATYRSIDLGRTASGATVLTYVRCLGPAGCKTYSDDLAGRRVSFKRLAPKRCRVTSAPARWRLHVAYGLRCTKPGGGPSSFDPARSGLFVRRGAAAPKRLRLPADQSRTDPYTVTKVDLRGTRVAALVAGSDGFTNEVVQTTTSAADMYSGFAAGGGDEARDFNGGMSLGTGGALWTLTFGFESSDSFSTIRRLDADGCRLTERLPDTPWSTQNGGSPATAMAADGHRVFLFLPGRGIVAHAFAPQAECG